MKIELPNLELDLLEQYKGRLKLGRVKLQGTKEHILKLK